MVEIEHKNGRMSKVIISYTAFFASLVTIASALMGILIFLFSIKTDVEVIKMQHERRIKNLERTQQGIKSKQWEFDLRIQRNHDKMENIYKNN